MVEPPPTPPGHWVQCPECQRFFENEQGRGSHRFHAHGIRSAPPRDFRIATPPVEVAPVKQPAADEAPSPPGPPAAPAVAPVLLPPVPALPPPPPVKPLAPPPEPASAEIEWSQPEAASTGLSVVAQSLANSRPPPHLGNVGRGVIVFVVLALSGLALYLVVRQLKGANAPTQAYTLQSTQARTPAPTLTTGDSYWDSVLGYRGLRL